MLRLFGLLELLPGGASTAGGMLTMIPVMTYNLTIALRNVLGCGGLERQLNVTGREKCRRRGIDIVPGRDHRSRRLDRPFPAEHRFRLIVFPFGILNRKKVRG